MHQESIVPRRRFRSTPARRFLLVILALVVAAGLLEGGTRVRQRLRFGTSGELFETRWDPKVGLPVPVPGETKGINVWIRINSLGFRSPELDRPKPPARVRLAFLGASTTFCAEASGNETTWPHLVWSALQSAYPSVTFDYVNAGVPGYRVEHSIRNLEHRVKPLSPDIIVIYESPNDLRHDTRRLAEAQNLIAGPPTKATWLAEWSVAWLIIEKNFQLLNRQRTAAAEQRRLAFDPRALSEGFRTRLTRLIRDAQRVAPIVAVATFSHKIRHEQSREQQLHAANTDLYYAPYMSLAGLLSGYDEYNRVIRQVARDTNIILIEGEELIPGDDEHFYDSVHFTDAGSRVMADRVLRHLTRSPGLVRFIERGQARSVAVPDQAR
jgi:lysophospholipase L1-like esterase